jgi:hypothetical protein
MTAKHAKKKRRVRGPGRRVSPAEIFGPKLTRNILQRPWETRPNLDGCSDLHSLARAIGFSLIIPRCVLGDQEVAREMLRRLREAADERRIPYRREHAVAAIADFLRIDSRSLANWLNRSRRQQI